MRILLITCLLSISTSLYGQKLSASLQNHGDGSQPVVLNAAGQTFAIDAPGIDFSYVEALTTDKAGFGATVLNKGENTFAAKHINRLGQPVLQIEEELFDPEDPSLKAWMFPDGRMVVRSGISNFSLYSSEGALLNSVNNSSGSQDGEGVSQFASDPAGSTMLFYTPDIRFGAKTGSQVKLYNEQNRSESTVYYSQDYRTDAIVVSGDGSLFLVLANDGNRSGEMVLFNRFGEELNRVALSIAAIGASLDVENEKITVFSDGRMQVYDMFSSKRSGSGSTRGSSIIAAQYFPDKNVVVSLNGNYSQYDGGISDLKVYVLDLKRSKLTSENVNGTAKLWDRHQIAFRRNASGSYSIFAGTGTISVNYQ